MTSKYSRKISINFNCICVKLICTENSGIGQIGVSEIGSDNLHPLSIKKSSNGILDAGYLVVDFEANVDFVAILDFDRPILGGLKVDLYNRR